MQASEETEKYWKDHVETRKAYGLRIGISDHLASEYEIVLRDDSMGGQANNEMIRLCGYSITRYGNYGKYPTSFSE